MFNISQMPAMNVKHGISFFILTSLFLLISWMADRDDYPSGESATGERETEFPYAREWYVAQRLYGNTAINIDAEIWKSYRAIQSTAQSSFSKSNSLLANEWKEEGPWNIAGRMRAIAFDPSNPDVVYAGAASGGIWKTTNQGTNWTPLTDHMPALCNGAIAIDPNNTDRIFVGTGEPEAPSSSRNNYETVIKTSIGLLRSDDAGRNWTVIPWSGNAGGAAHRIAIHPQSADTIIVATISDLWKTTNAGQTWSRIYSGYFTDVLYKPGQPSRVYAAIGYDFGGSSNGVYVSDAGGKSYTWRKLATNFPSSDSCGRILLGVSRQNPERIYAAVALNRSKLQQAAIYNDFLLFMVSTNGGETWERKIGAIPVDFARSQAYYDFAMAVSPFDHNIIFLGGYQTWRSLNGGVSFQQVSSGGNMHVDIHSIVFHPTDGNIVFVGNDGGIFRSGDRGNSWSSRNTALGTIQFYRSAYDYQNTANVFGGTQDNGTLGKINQPNSNWMPVVRITQSDGGNIVIDPTTNAIRYGSVLDVNSQRTITRIPTRYVNGAELKMEEGMNAGAQQDRLNWVPPMMLHPNDRNKLYTATQFIYAMKNPSTGTPRWSIISPDFTAGGLVTEFDIPPTNGDWMYAVTSTGRVNLTKDLNAADPTWENISNGLPNRWICDIMADWNDHLTAYIALSGFGTGHVYKTTDGGQSWVNISGDLPNIPVNSIVRSRIDPNTIFLGTDLGVWATKNGGVNWQQFGSGLPNVAVYDVKIAANNTLVVGTHGRGIWTTSAIVSVNHNPVVIPRELSLGQNFPNPFSSTNEPSTQIPFTLPQKQHVKLCVLNLRGEVVSVLLDDVRARGEYLVNFSARYLASGLYFYRLDAENASLMRTMLLAK